MQRFLQVDDDLAAVGKHQSDHAPDTLVVDVSIAVVVDAVTGQFHRSQQLFGVIHEFEIGHYNLSMGIKQTILVRGSSLVVCVAAISAALMASGCGQKGGLVLPNDPDFKQRATLPDIVKRQFPDLPLGNKPAQNAASSPESAASGSR